MVDKHSNEVAATPAPAPDATTSAPRRAPAHRGADIRDSVAEMAERAQLISQEAGSKVAAAMKDVISAGAGIAGFAIESARDLVQYMVRRGQMTPEEADKLIREAEAAHDKRPASEKSRPTATKIAAERAATAKAEAAAARAAMPPVAPTPFRPVARPVVSPSGSNGAERTLAAKPAVAKAPAVKTADKAASHKPAAAKPAGAVKTASPAKTATKTAASAKSATSKSAASKLSKSTDKAGKATKPAEAKREGKGKH